MLKVKCFRDHLAWLGRVGALSLASLLVWLVPTTARAQCAQWDVSGKWTIKVAGGIIEYVDLKQDGENLTGKTVAYGSGTTKVTGTIKANEFSLTMDWTEAGKTFDPSVYPSEFFLGKVGSDGIIHGMASLLTKPDLAGTGKNPWSSDRAMNCSHPFTPIGRLKITPTTGSAQADATPATLTPPGIIASPNNIALVAGKGTGRTTLTWDAGRAHPYAEVWVRVDDQDETKIVEAGKGTLQVAVVPGKTYLYILTDAGKTLATVTVRFHR